MARLQMPPVMRARRDVEDVLVNDAELDGYDNVNYVFTDISVGLSNHVRSLFSCVRMSNHMRSLFSCVRMSDHVRSLFSCVRMSDHMRSLFSCVRMSDHMRSLFSCVRMSDHVRSIFSCVRMSNLVKIFLLVCRNIKSYRSVCVRASVRPCVCGASVCLWCIRVSVHVCVRVNAVCSSHEWCVCPSV